jgi:hypothetical protein
MGNAAGIHLPSRSDVDGPGWERLTGFARGDGCLAATGLIIEPW